MGRNPGLATCRKRGGEKPVGGIRPGRKKGEEELLLKEKRERLKGEG